jgi:hypothetical protein
LSKYGNGDVRILVSWVGQTDLNAASGVAEAGIGPIGQAVTSREFGLVALLSNYPKDKTAVFLPWVERRTKATVELTLIELTRPTHFGEIYQAATQTVGRLLERFGDNARLTFHLSPGTPAMAAVWIILAKTRFGAELIESSRQRGVETANIPFDLSAEYIPDVYRSADRGLVRLGAGLTEEAPEFADIIHRGRRTHGSSPSTSGSPRLFRRPFQTLRCRKPRRSASIAASGRACLPCARRLRSPLMRMSR